MSFRLFFPIFAAFVFSSCSGDSSPSAPGEEEEGTLNFEFTFATSDEGFSGGFSDYPEEIEANMNPVFQYTSLPETFAPERKGLKIAGSNSSDDLFMFIKKRLDSEKARQRRRNKSEQGLSGVNDCRIRHLGGLRMLRYWRAAWRKRVS